MPSHIAIDVDQTILDDDGHLIAGVRETLARMHANEDYELQLWSKGGAEYARKIADKFDLSQYFKSYGSKPDVAIDDLPEDAAPVSRTEAHKSVKRIQRRPQCGTRAVADACHWMRLSES